MAASPTIEIRFEHASAAVEAAGAAEARLIKWKVKPGSRVICGSVLALYDDEPVDDTPKDADKLKRFKANLVGTVLELLVSEGDTVHRGSGLLMLEGCSHPVVMKNMCAECGADLLEMKRELKQSTASVAMVHSIPELVVSQEQAQILGRADEERLIKSRKLVLLVDLDQTLVHTTNDNIPNNIRDVHHFQLYGSRSKWYHVRIRPGTEQFLKTVSQLYELHICTFGARYYAHIIAKFLDKDGRYFSHRILSRDECFSANSKLPNLKALFPCGDHMVCIIDDREDVWNYLPNVVHVKPYHFFQHTGDIHAPPGLAKMELDESGKYVVGAQQPETTASDEASIDSSSIGTELPDKKVDDVVESVTECITTDDNDAAGSNGSSVDSAETVKVEESLEKCETVEPDTPSKSEEKTDPDVKDENEEKASEIETKDDDTVDVKDEDDYLLYLTDILTKIHTAFYKSYDHVQQTEAHRKIPNLRDIVPHTRRHVLRGVRIVFSGVIPTNVVVEKSHAYQVAKSLGAQVQPRLIKTKSRNDKGENKKDVAIGTTHLVAARLGTVKVSEARRMPSVHIVTPQWLWCCASRWDHVDERLFPLTKDSSGQSHEAEVDKAHRKSAAAQKIPQASTGVDASREYVSVYPTYDPVTGKRINKSTQQNGNKESEKPVDCRQETDESCASIDSIDFRGGDGGECSSGETRKSSAEKFVESINPLMSFASEDIASMDQEVEDFLDSPDNESSSDEEDREQRTRMLVLHPKREGDGSSSDESLGDARAKRWSQKRKLSEDGGTPEKYPRGELLPIDSDRSVSGTSSENDSASAGSIGSVDDEMADAVERQLLEL